MQLIYKKEFKNEEILSLGLALVMSACFHNFLRINLHWPDIGFPTMTYRELGIPLILRINSIAIIRAIDIGSRQ